MKRIARELFSLVVGKTVDSVLAVFNDVIADLEKVQARHDTDATIEAVKEMAARASKESAQNESARAAKAAARIKALLA